jgi:hypothetical protein
MWLSRTSILRGSKKLRCCVFNSACRSGWLCLSVRMFEDGREVAQKLANPDSMQQLADRFIFPADGGKAERVGFEPTRRLNTAYAISNRAPSANSDTSPEATQGSLPKGEAHASMCV